MFLFIRLDFKLIVEGVFSIFEKILSIYHSVCIFGEITPVKCIKIIETNLIPYLENIYLTFQLIFCHQMIDALINLNKKVTLQP